MLSIRPVSVGTGLLLVLAAAGTATAQRPPAEFDFRDGACFYQNPNYRGESFCVRAGEEVRAVPDGLNDRISSIRTFGRPEVTVYRDQSFRGPSVRFDGDVPDLRPTNWNDRVSSVRVTGDRYGYRGYDDRGYYDRYDRDAGQMVRRAYRDVLNRYPDDAGMQYYRRRIVSDGWSEANVREDLRRGGAYAPGTFDRTSAYNPARARAEDVVRNAYRSVLHRDLDPGSEGYIERVMHDGWSQADVERELRRSAEYRNQVR